MEASDNCRWQAHIDQIAADYGVKVDQRQGMDGMMYVEERHET